MKPLKGEREQPLEPPGQEQLLEEESARDDEFILGDAHASEDEFPAQATSPTPLRKFYLYLATSPQAETAFRVAGLLCALLAAALLWRGQTESAFVVAVLGVVAWFLGLRNRLRRAGIVKGAMQQKEMAEEEDEI